MGQYRLSVTAVGPHGDHRDIKDGGVVVGCESDTCFDCRIRRFVAALGNLEEATLTHWPGKPDEVVDDLVTGVRKGSF
jgi:hypothetical protein